jgi:outer membrane translocation and assembly module TamA
MTARVGLSQGRIAVPERFFAGGSNSFRGQQFDYLGPKDPDTGKPVGGKALFLLNVEVPFPIFASFKDLSGVVFGDVGNVYPEIRDFRIRDLETAAGLGLRYRTPLGPVRIELAWRLGAPERRGKPLFFITIGNVF